MLYASKKADLQELESLFEKGLIDLFYGDESQVSSEGYVPYGWQFADEQVAIYVEKGYKSTIFGLISRSSESYSQTSQHTIDSAFVCQFLDRFSFQIKKETVVILDNASVHRSKLVKQNMPIWEQRGLFLFFLPPYCPHLNIAETMWRKLKTEWLLIEDYLEKEALLYAVNRCMTNVGINLTINFSPFNNN